MPASDRDAESWLKRAQEAAAQEDWKLAADTLSRVIDQFGDKTVSPDDGKHFFSALRCAQQQIEQWPEAGLAMYRLLYDPEVRQRLEAARSAHDLDALRQIGRKYPYTNYGPEAINLLAVWLIDRQEGGEAVDLLRRLLELPHAAIPKWKTFQKLAIACALTGDFESAALSITQMRDAASTMMTAASRTTTAPAPDDLARRIEAVSRFVEEARLHPGSAAGGPTNTWPTLLGPPSVAGRMAAIDPAVTPETASRDALAGAGRLRASDITRLIKRTGRPPVWQMVSDGRMLFVCGPEGVTARDLGTFDFLWKGISRRPPRDRIVEQQRVLTGINDADNSDRLDEMTTQALFHEYRGAVSTAQGLVFSIEQAGTPREQFPSKEGVTPPNNIFIGDDFAEPNSLRAFEAETGRAVWTKGRGGPIDDGLRFAHFFAAPVAAGSNLVAPYQLAADFQLAVLSREGKLLKTILLGTGQPGMFPMNGVLPLTVYEGTIYVSTGAGMFIALSAYDYSLRWQTPYEREALAVSHQASPRQWGPAGPATGGLAQPDEWLASPPVIIGGLVILAAPDSDSLRAFDRNTGTLKWQFPRGDHRYLVGTDGHLLFLAGKGVLALDAATGQSKWAYNKSAVLGRAALCGDLVYVPTESGLVRLDAATGEPRGESMATEEPLGNLFAIDGALYSLTADSICKFPDIQRSRSIAMQALERDPGDRHSLLRLAHLATLKKEWAEAIGFLDRADAAIGRGAPGAPQSKEENDLADRIRHLRIGVILQLAGQAKAQDRATWLARAVELAKRPSDAALAGLALCELEKEQRQLPAAFSRALSLVKQYGDEPMLVEDELVSTVGVIIGQRIGSIISEANDAERDALYESCRQQERDDLVALSHPAPDVAALERIARASDGLGPGACGAHLDLELGKAAQRTGDSESACFYLSRTAARDSKGTDTAFEARLRLAIVLTVPAIDSPAAQPMQAKRLIESLRAESGNRQMPSDLSVPGMERMPAGVMDLLNALAAKLPQGQGSAKAMPGILTETPALELVAEETVSANLPPDVRSYFDPLHPLDPFTGVVPIRILKQIKGVAASGRTQVRPIWASMLNMSLDDDMPIDQRTIDLVAHPAAVAGLVAVLDAGSQYCAVGLASGRQLWPPVAIDRTQGPLPEPPVIQIGGIAILAIDPTTLLAVPARPDAKPIWRRHFPARRLRLLADVEGKLAVVEGDAEQVALIDPATGRLYRQFALDSKAPASRPTGGEGSETPSNEVRPPLAIVGKMVCSARGTAVVGRDLATGQQVWSQRSAMPVHDMRALNERYAALVHPDDSLDVVRAGDGEVVRSIELPGLGGPPVEMIVDEQTTGGRATERICIYAKTDGDPPKFLLISIPLDPKGETWRRDLGRFASVNRQMLRASPLFVAAMQYTAANGDNRPKRADNSPIDKAMLLIFDKATGARLLESPYEFDFSRGARIDGSTRLIKDVIVMDQRIIAVAPEGYYVLAKSSTPHETSKGAREPDAQ